jgi:hypothetical protein
MVEEDQLPELRRAIREHARTLVKSINKELNGSHKEKRTQRATRRRKMELTLIETDDSL